jgi:sulfate permease, SulP family
VVKRPLEKLGIAGLIPGHHCIGDRLTALQEGLAMVREKQGYSDDETDKTFPSLS